MADIGDRIRAMVGIGLPTPVEGEVVGEGRDWAGRTVLIVREDDGTDIEVLPAEIIEDAS